jgi:hypothetical protein
MTKPGAKNNKHMRHWPRFFRGSSVENGKKGGPGPGPGAGAGWSKGDELDKSRSTMSTCKEAGDVDVHRRITLVEGSAADTDDLSSILSSPSTHQYEVNLIPGDDDIPMFIKVSKTSEENDAPTVAVVSFATAATTTTGGGMLLQATTARRLDALRIQRQLQGANHPDVLFASKYLECAHRRRAELQHTSTSTNSVEAVLRAGCDGETGTANRTSTVVTAQQRGTCQNLSPQWY